MYQVVPITEFEHLEPYREAWTRLVKEDPRAQFTQSYEWLESYWKAFGHDKFLECHVVMFGDEPVGFAPFVLKKVSTRLGPVRLMTWPLDSWGVGYRPIGRNVTSTLFPAFRALQGSNDFDILDLRYLPEDAGLRDRCVSACRLARVPVNASRWQKFASFSADCFSHWSIYVSRDLEIIEHSRQKSEKLEFVRLRPDAAATEVMELWHRVVHLFDESLQSYLTGCVQGAAKLGMLDLAVAMVGDRAESVVVGHHHGSQYEVLAISPPSHASQQASRSWLLGRIILELPWIGDEIALFRQEYVPCVANWSPSLAWTMRLTNFRTPRLKTRLLHLSRKMFGPPPPAKRRHIPHSAGGQPHTSLRLLELDSASDEPTSTRPHASF